MSRNLRHKCRTVTPEQKVIKVIYCYGGGGSGRKGRKDGAPRAESGKEGERLENDLALQQERNKPLIALLNRWLAEDEAETV
jgi:hypothetical protein